MKKCLIALSLCLCIILLLSSTPIYATDSIQSINEFAGGDGTEANPYLIETKEHLNNARNHLDAHFKMVANIEFADPDFAEGGQYYNNGAGWLPIGNEGVPFTGSFDGDNHTISGISITASAEGNLYAGLFGYTTGNVKNVNIVDSSISISANSTAQSTIYHYIYVGALVGYGRYATLENCHHSGTLDVTCISTTRKYYIYAGGLAGYANVTNCSNFGKLDAKITPSNGKYIDACIGGIAGRADTAIQCENSGIISANSTRNDSHISIGGIVGSGRKVELCSNSGSISANGNMWQSIRIGGICGSGSDGFTAKQCYNSGIVDGSSESTSGGIVGYIGGSGSIRNCFNIGNIDGGWCAGIVGNTFDTVSIYTCYNSGLVPEGYSKYSILGSAREYVIENCYSLEGMAKTRVYTTVCTTEAMSKQDTYVNFDFDNVWTLDNSAHYPWPMLKNVPIHSDMIDISTSTIHFDNEQVQYLTAQPKVTVLCNGKELTLGTDYILQFTVGESSWFAKTGWNRKMEAIGTAKVRVIGIGNYYNCKDSHFEVVKYDLSYATVRVNGDSIYLQDFEYDGTKKTQSNIVLRDKNSNVISNEHYEVTYKNNVEIGIATMIITAKGDYYSGAIEKQFQIYPRPILYVEVSKLPDKLVYTVEETQVDVTGGEITIYYQDGGIETVSMMEEMLDGDYNLSMIGYQNIWLEYNGSPMYFVILVIKYPLGDLDGNMCVDNKDVEFLLWHTLFPQDYPLPQDADFNSDGYVDNNDVEYLLWHTLFPSDYPL